MFTDEFEICRPDGSAAARNSRGRFVSFDPDVFPFRSLGKRTNTAAVYLPAGRWIIKDRSGSGAGLEFDAVEEDMRMRVGTSCTDAELHLDNDSDICLVKLGEKAVASFDAAAYSGKDPVKGIVETVFSGKTGESEVTFGLEKGQIVAEGGADSVILVNGRPL